MISVIVPVYNSAEYLNQCIRCLIDQDYPKPDYELIFVDNGSTDNSIEILRGYPEVNVLSELTRGAYAARNRGVAAARGDVVAFTDPDCYPASGWLRAIAQTLSADEVQVVLGARLPPNDDSSMRLLAAYENVKTKMVCSSDDAMIYYGYTNNMAVRRSVMDRFGPFVERMRGSDTIFVRHVVEGFSCQAVVYHDDAAVVHAEVESFGDYLWKVMTYSRSRRAYGHIAMGRPLSQRERLQAFKQTARGRPLSESVPLLCLLGLGAAAWFFAGSTSQPETRE